MLIAIDHGNSRIKTLLTSFVSGYTKYGTELPMMVKKVIRFGDSFYALTETRLPYQFNKTQTEDFYLLTLFAIAKEITAQEVYRPDEIEIELAVGLLLKFSLHHAHTAQHRPEKKAVGVATGGSTRAEKQPAANSVGSAKKAIDLDDTALDQINDALEMFGKI